MHHEFVSHESDTVSGFGKQYAVLLDKLSRKYNLVIPKIVYGELSLMFDSEIEINAFLTDAERSEKPLSQVIKGIIKPIFQN